MNLVGRLRKHREKTRAQFAKECSIVNVLRERERCAEIAEGMPGGGAIAAAIRSQPEDFKTLGELMAEESRG